MFNPTQRRASRIAGVFFVAITLLAMGAAFASANDAYEIRSLSGSVEFSRGKSTAWSAGVVGQALGAGDRIRTAARSKAEVGWGGQTLRLYENSMLRLPASERPAQVESGQAIIDVMKRRASGNPFKIETKDIVVVVRGTRFAVDLDQGEGTRVAVFEGEVALHDQADSEAFPMSVRPGYMARMGGVGAPMITPHGMADPWSSWSDSAPAAPDYGQVEPTSGDPTRSALRNAVQERMPRDRVGALDDPDRDRPSVAPAAIDPVVDIGDPASILGRSIGVGGGGGGGGEPIVDND